MLRSISYDDFETVLLFQYDVITRKTYNFVLDNVDRIEDCESSIFADSKNLYLFSELENKHKEYFLSLLVFRRKQKNGRLYIYRNSTFCLQVIT